mmetsp:Transcript_11801/g.35517  ORF Transcript_11801/g.35517 Transcript_11801/m.35517 type:complete len:100 (-) Transcript_11801:32-331(-)
MFTENTYGMMCNCVDCEHDYDFWYETYLKNADDSEEAVEDHWYIEKGCDDLPEIVEAIRESDPTLPIAIDPKQRKLCSFWPQSDSHRKRCYTCGAAPRG